MRVELRGILLTASVVAIDQASKFAASSWGACADRTADAALMLCRSEHWAADGSALPVARFAGLLPAVVLAGVLFQRWPRVALAFAVACAGGLSNALDAFRHGFVVNVLRIGLPIDIAGFDATIVNVADLAIVVGLVLTAHGAGLRSRGFAAWSRPRAVEAGLRAPLTARRPGAAVGPG